MGVSSQVCSLVQEGEEFILMSDFISTAHEAIIALEKKFPAAVLEPIRANLLQQQACSQAVKEGKDWAVALDDKELCELQAKNTRVKRDKIIAFEQFGPE
jgi:hypothetical protein